MVSTIAGASISVLVSSNRKDTRKSRWLDLPPVTNALRKNADRRKGGFFIPKNKGKEKMNGQYCNDGKIRADEAD
jgi:hypothetical protein